MHRTPDLRFSPASFRSDKLNELKVVPEVVFPQKQFAPAYCEIPPMRGQFWPIRVDSEAGRSSMAVGTENTTNLPFPQIG